VHKFAVVTVSNNNNNNNNNNMAVVNRKWEGIVGTGWSGLRIGTGGGHL
jgi:hypothetical protein